MPFKVFVVECEEVINRWKGVRARGAHEGEPRGSGLDRDHVEVRTVTAILS